ncbi:MULTISPECIES: hypothetical protein [unclassified Acinetobacter]|uniref:hypothetical protein n=1 Tax=unclassified Acinetobacter TaxID=196816 RepID=UPI002446B751|nr:MULTISPECIES: hypothetical protein [unclassified Acinetobacter]MDH0031901.1 hypothetical protein [Acinetobacter sp. GD04021]MDH0887586.1 hypothetical protein [Acinetobacter sp. GD03873]MDH1083906.1 hypothetical protein [Acinetobacter sp. GD03983]MDH2190960.1 hypothetical protein [Acinetobacter sp. GD03645]MDH2204375.1 hypothetical protein [Acinetobacter sp. GD03647]
MVMNNEIFQDLQSKYGLQYSDKNFSGEGFVEECAVIRGKLNGRFYLGAYSQIDFSAICNNAYIGRFTIIERNCYIGRKKYRSALSNHPFIYGDTINNNFKDSYYSLIKTNRFFYEKDKISFIGSDVVVGQNSVITEGVVIGDGAIIYPNSYVDEDVPPYSIVAGSPATIIGFRFEEDIIEQLLIKKWWKYDFSQIIKNFKGIINYINNNELIEKVISEDLKNLSKNKFYLNTIRGDYCLNKINTCVVGPSHIQIWHKKWLESKLDVDDFYLLPIPAMSLMSNQSENLIKWWVDWFDNVILFVPDFRIGNVTTFSNIHDGRFIEPESISNENDIESFRIGLNRLDQYQLLKKVKFIFWCLYGRESLNKLDNKFINGNGAYSHPIWNYTDLVKRYQSVTIDVSTDFLNIEKFIVDKSIHPTDECYRKLNTIISSYVSRDI